MRSRIGASGSAATPMHTAPHRTHAKTRPQSCRPRPARPGAHRHGSGNDIGHDVVEARDRGGHFLGLGLPQPRGALDVSQQQRHRAGRQKPAHTKLAPVHQRRVRAWVDLAHASQHAATTWRRNISANVQIAADRGRNLRPPNAHMYAFRRMVWASRRRIVDSSATPGAHLDHRYRPNQHPPERLRRGVDPRVGRPSDPECPGAAVEPAAWSGFDVALRLVVYAPPPIVVHTFWSGGIAS
jgi:hypothetical protein